MKHSLLRDAIRRALFAGAVAALALPLHAQEGTGTTDAGTAAPKEMDTITVTGSRIQRAVDRENVQPVGIITREEMQRSGFQSVADLLQSSVVMGSPAISRSDALASGEAVGGAFVSIRNLGAARTLVLVNGQRLGITTGGLADVSQIPTSAVERIEILKDGASAIYGSDAIAGVVNIITRRHVEGGDANVYFGQYDVGDGKKQQYDVSLGMSDDDGWLTMSVQYAKEDPVWAKDRDFSASGNGPLHPYDGRSGISEKGVVFVGGARYTLKDGGDPTNWNDYREYVPLTDNSNPNEQMSLLTGQERRAFYLNAGRDLTDSITLEVDALYNSRDTTQQIAGYPFRSNAWGQWSAPISADSAYNPRPGEELTYFRRTWEVPRVTLNKATTHRLGAKLVGHFDLGTSPWNWDAGFFQSKFRTVKDGGGNLLLPAAQRATGASWFNPATQRVECGSAASPIPYGSSYGNGECIPWNPLVPAGVDAPGSLADPALQAYLFPIGHDTGETDTNAYFANASGVLAELPAGDLAMAVGYEHRQEKGAFSPDALRQSGLSTDLGSGNTAGQYHLDEVYAEFEVPLLRDVAFARSLSLNLASRYSNYSTFGAVTRSKAGIEWRPIDDVMLRGTWGQGFRAPTISDLYGPQDQSFEFYTDPCDTLFGAAKGTAACLADVPANFRQPMSGGLPAPGPMQQSDVPFLSGSNVNLQPESSRNLTFGVVYSPQQVEGLSVSLDWWKVRVEDAIVSDSPTTVLDDCYLRGDAARCAQFTRDPVTGAVQTLAFNIKNFGYVETAGYDISASYHLPTQRWGNLGFGWDTTYVDYYETKFDPAAAHAVQYAGVGATFRVRSNLSADWSLGDWGVRWTARHFSSMREACVYTAECSDPTFQAPYTNGNIVPRNRTGSNTFNDMQVRYATPWNSTVSLGVNNVFDRMGQTLYTRPASSFPYYGGFDIGRFIYLQYNQKF
jgi:iron complex outermembrane receptor protein